MPSWARRPGGPWVITPACAERNGGKVVTLDRRDFGVVAREGTITVLPG